MKDYLNELETCCMFLGNARTGSSLIGSLLDAHPDVVIAQELNVIRWLLYKLREQKYKTKSLTKINKIICKMMINNSKKMAEKKRKWGPYRYWVEGHWQGRFRKLKVIGEKEAHTTAKIMAKRPKMIKKFEDIMGIPIKYIHVVRNPFDTIARIHLRSKTLGLKGAKKEFFQISDYIEKLYRIIKRENIHLIRHEDLICNPKEEIFKLCDFLKIDKNEEYINACSKVVYTRPHKTREEIMWPSHIVDSINKQLALYPSLCFYSFSV